MCLFRAAKALTEAGLGWEEGDGCCSYTDPSAVAQLEQCQFIKANKRMKLRPSQIITWLQTCLCNVLGAMH